MRRKDQVKTVVFAVLIICLTVNIFIKITKGTHRKRAVGENLSPGVLHWATGPYMDPNGLRIATGPYMDPNGFLMKAA